MSGASRNNYYRLITYIIMRCWFYHEYGKILFRFLSEDTIWQFNGKLWIICDVCMHLIYESGLTFFKSNQKTCILKLTGT